MKKEKREPEGSIGVEKGGEKEPGGAVETLRILAREMGNGLSGGTKK